MANRRSKSLKSQRTVAPWLAPRRALLLPVERIDPVINAARRRVGRVHITASWMPDFQFVYVLAGAGTYTFAGRTYDLGPGHFFCVPPYRRFAFLCPDPSFEMSTVLFDFSPTCPGVSRAERLAFMQRHAHKVTFPRGMRIPRHLVFARGGVLDTLFRELPKAFASSSPVDQFRAKVLLQRIVLMVLDRSLHDTEDHSGPTLAQAKLEQAMAYIDAHLATPLSVATLARLADFSTSHFSRTFRQWVGQTPAEYLQRRRIEQAKRLLEDVHLSVKQIAYRVGFRDPLHFSRVFRRMEGLPPSSYRREVLSHMIPATTKPKPRGSRP